jgi:hypothetical protein
MVDQRSILSIGNDASEPLEHPRGFRYVAVGFIFHFLLATMGSLLFAFVALGAALGMLLNDSGAQHSRLFQILRDIPYSPAFWGSGLLLGLIVNAFRRDRVACWVWVGGIAWLGLGVYGSVPSHNPPWCPPAGCPFLQNAWDSLFSLNSERCAASECLGKLLVTVPVLSSFAYSIGSRLSLRPTSAEAYRS